MASNNPSVRRFRTDMKDLVNKAKYNFHKETLAMADELIGNMRSAISHSVTGHLSESLRKKDVTNADGTKISVLVMAGGKLTTKYTAAGPFDYALAEEFGTTKETPHPFFFGTYRLYQRSGLEQYRETLDQTIAENNRQRASRASGYYQLGAQATIGHRFSTVSSAATD
jgi:hypothetical protein